ncbi:MAG: homing endonuclease associated repeat-containing protein [Solirubrobacteraceae bacterium]
MREIAARTHALEVDRAEDILSMHTELKDVREVARRLGVSQTMVRDVVRAAERANPQPASRSRRKFGSTRKRYSDSELLECLKIASQELGGVLTTEAYIGFVRGRTLGDGRPWPSNQVYRLRFGSWVDALHKAGLRANPRTPIAGRPLFTPAHCTNAVGHLARQLGHAPSAAEYDVAARASDGALPSLATVRQRCGGWLGALRLAGF